MERHGLSSDETAGCRRREASNGGGREAEGSVEPGGVRRVKCCGEARRLCSSDGQRSWSSHSRGDGSAPVSPGWPAPQRTPNACTLPAPFAPAGSGQWFKDIKTPYDPAHPNDFDEWQREQVSCLPPPPHAGRPSPSRGGAVLGSVGQLFRAWPFCKPLCCVRRRSRPSKPS